MVTGCPKRCSSTYRVQPADSDEVGASHAISTFGASRQAPRLLPIDVPDSTYVVSIGTTSAPCVVASATSRSWRSAPLSDTRTTAVPIG